MITAAEVRYRNKQLIWIYLPDISLYKGLTFPADRFPTRQKGDQFQVDISDKGIYSRDRIPPHWLAGWTADLTERQP